MEVTPYKDFRDKIEDFDILQCEGKSFFGWLIKRVTGSKRTHIAILFWDRRIDRVMVYESLEGKGVRIVPLSFYLKYKGKVFITRHSGVKKALEIDGNKKLHDASVFATDLLGYKYDKMEILRITSRIIFRYKKKPGRDMKFICSEYGWELENKIGVSIPWSEDGNVRPKEFNECPDITDLWRMK